MDKRVFVSLCDNYTEARAAVGRVLDAFGGAAAILGGRRRVLVKPNLIMPKKPEAAATTHPAVVEAVCAAFVKAGAAVEILDSTGGPHTRAILKMLYSKCGMAGAAERSGASLSYNVKSRRTIVKEGRVLRKASLLAPVLDADLVITVAKVKTHSFMGMTGCSKNLFGCVPGMTKPLLHGKFPKKDDFAGMLVDVCQAVNPGFSILDGVWGMEGAGPTGGDPKHLRVIAGGINPYALDLAQCHLMGLRTDSVHTIAEAAGRGLAPACPSELEWLGDDPATLRTQFLPAIRHKGGALPQILDSCTGCGDCVRICPKKCVGIKNGIAVIAERDCIRCYCCHEFCPFKAVGLE
jgi:uncharacterized protein (DUF362 family)/Pyruvate/2-oxoacid:ferredoxin oxidoreductase delta subunit